MIRTVVRHARSVSVLLAATAALAGCGGATTSPPPPGDASPTTPASPAPADPAAADGEVRSAYATYNNSLLKRDFTTTCASMTPAARSKIPNVIAEKGGPKNLTCEQAFTLIYQQPGAAQPLDAASKGITINKVDVVGDQATIAFSATNGKSGTAKASRQDGKWLFEANG